MVEFYSVRHKEQKHQQGVCVCVCVILRSDLCVCESSSVEVQRRKLHISTTPNRKHILVSLWFRSVVDFRVPG